MTPRIRRWLTLAALLALGATGLGLSLFADDGARPLTLEAAADAGRESYTVTLEPMGRVRFPRVPQRAMTLDAQYEDMLVALDAEDRLVATGFAGNVYDGFYDQIPGLTVRIDRATLPQVGVGLDKELLYALDADIHHIDPVRLVRMTGWKQADIDEIARNVGPFFANRYSREHAAPVEGYTFYSAWTLATKVGEAYRRAERIAALGAIYDGMVADIQARLPPESARPTVGLVMYANGRFTPFSLSRQGFGTAQYRAVGARDAFASIRELTYGAAPSTGIDVEGLLAIDPDVLIMPFAVFESFRARFATLAGLAHDPLVGRLRAMRSDRVYPGGTPLQGPIFLLFQTEMAAKQLYPERFGRFRFDAPYPPDEQLFDRAQVARALGIDPAEDTP